MNEADKVLTNILISYGVEILDENMSLKDFSVDTLINATSLCLEKIFGSQGETTTFPKKCPDSMISRYKAIQRLIDGLKKLGYTQTIGYQSFLYPNEKDTRNIVSFLVDHLPKEKIDCLVTSTDSPSNLKLSIQDVFAQSLSEPWFTQFCNNVKVGSHIEARSIMLNLHSQEVCNEANGWSLPLPTVTQQCKSFPELIAAIYTHNKLSKLITKIDWKPLVPNLEDKSTKVIPKDLPVVPITRRRSKFMVQKQGNPEKTSGKKRNEENELIEAEKKLDQLRLQYGESAAQFNATMSGVKKLENVIRKLHEKEAIMNRALREEERVRMVLANGADSLNGLKEMIAKKTQQIQSIEQAWDIHRDKMKYKINKQRRLKNTKSSKPSGLFEQHQDIMNFMNECNLDYQTQEELMVENTERIKNILAQVSMDNVLPTRNNFTKKVSKFMENKKKQDDEIQKMKDVIGMVKNDITNLREKLGRKFIDTHDLILQCTKYDKLSKNMYKVLITIHENCQSLINVIEEKGKLIHEIKDLEMKLEVENGDNIDKNLVEISKNYEAVRAKYNKLKEQIEVARK